MSEVNSWSTTAASNNSASPDGFPEGMAPSGVNDSMREVMAALAKYRSDTDGVNTSSGTDTITLSASRVMTAYTAGDRYCFKAGGTNTGAATLNVDTLGAKSIKRPDGTPLVAGDITSGMYVDVVYDGTNFILLNRHIVDATSTVKGVAELATNAEALAGSSTSVVVTPGNLGSDQTKSNTGHMVLPGNILVNWARLSFSGATGPETATWSKAFSGTPYVATVGRTLDVNAHVNLGTFNTTTIGATLSTAGTGTVYVIAIGPA